MILLQDVFKSFEQADTTFDALREIDLHVKKGECVVLKGASGSGKSTLLSLIAGLQKPTSGYIEVDGKAIAKLPEAHSAQFRRETIGFIFQKYHLIPSLSVEENILAPLIPFNLPLHEAKEKVQNVMEQFSISHKAHLHVKLLSGGEQQRTAIARALVCSPKILLADEPTANLDVALSLSLMGYFEMLKNKGVSIVIATHDAMVVEQSFVDRVVELKNGCIVS